VTRLLRSLVAAMLLLGFSAAAVLAHPLGNFTINHYAGIRVEPDRIRLDVVIDEAEIPTFQVTQRLDRDGDGSLSPAETAGLPVAACTDVGRKLALTVDGSAAPLTLVAAGAAFPQGNGGLSTMRLVCELESPVVVRDGTHVALRDDFEAARIGWREMTAVGSGVTVVTPGVPAASTSSRLTSYVTSLASAPDVRELAVDVRRGGPILADPPVPDAAAVEPVLERSPGSSAAPTVGASDKGVASNPAAAAASPGPVVADPASAVANPGSAGSAVPGGADALPDVIRRAPVDPLLAVVSLVVAAALGAGHALTPGHGKTLMAAYLVGVRGTRRHALGLGLTVSVTHTLGILVLAVVVLAAESTLPADVVVRIAPVVAAGSIVVVGSWMLLSEVRRRVAVRAGAREHETAHSLGLEHDHGEHPGHDGVHHDDHEHGHDEGHEHAVAHEAADHDHDDVSGEHRHGLVPHRHLPAGDAPLRWRSLAMLGLAGGLIPSANALLILLGTIAAGRPAWGVVLVASFGVGMAGVMAGIGLLVVQARSLLDRASRPGPLATARRLVPLGASLAVLGFGIVLSVEAIGAARLG